MSCVGARARRQRAARGRRRTALRRGAVTRQVRNRLTGRSHPRQNPRGGGRVRGRHRGGPRAPCRMRTVCFRNRIKRTLLKRQRPPDSAHAMPDTGHVPAQPRRGWLWGSGQVPALLGPVCAPGSLQKLLCGFPNRHQYFQNTTYSFLLVLWNTQHLLFESEHR